MRSNSRTVNGLNTSVTVCTDRSDGKNRFTPLTRCATGIANQLYKRHPRTPRLKESVLVKVYNNNQKRTVQDQANNILWIVYGCGGGGGGGGTEGGRDT